MENGHSKIIDLSGRVKEELEIMDVKMLTRGFKALTGRHPIEIQPELVSESSESVAGFADAALIVRYDGKLVFKRTPMDPVSGLVWKYESDFEL